MPHRLFSYRDRPVHLGPYPLERLPRQPAPLDSAALRKRLPVMQALSFDDPNPRSIKHAMARFIGMFDVIREGRVAATQAQIPADPQTRAEHLKAAAYYFDASMAGTTTLAPDALLATPIRNPMAVQLGAELAASQPKSFAAGIDMILADVIESSQATHGSIAHHTHALVVLVEYPRDPAPGEIGCEWLGDSQAQRAAVLAAQTAVLLSSYLRLLGYPARSHTATCSEVDLPMLAVTAGLCALDANDHAVNPWLGRRFGLARTASVDLPSSSCRTSFPKKSFSSTWRTSFMSTQPLRMAM